MATGVDISQLPAAQVLTGTELGPLVVVAQISGITQAINAVVTISTESGVNPFAVGNGVLFNGVGGMTAINGQGAIVSAVGGTEGAWTITVPINTSSYGAFTSGGVLTTTVQAQLASMLLSAGAPYNGTFQSGQVQVAGPGGVNAGNNNLIFGLALPNPTGIPAACLLLGSGGGSGTPITACLIMDQAFDDITPGNNLIVTSGETQGAGTANGGSYGDYGGATFGGTGGTRSIQGGTSANAAGGMTIVGGGNATGTTSAAVPGDTFAIAGQVGQQGATLHLIATVLNGVAKFIRHRFNSTITIDELVDGSWFFYAVDGGTFGAAGAPLISRGTGQPMGPAIPGTDVVTSHVMPTKALTTGGTNGSLTITNGLITAVVDPT